MLKCQLTILGMAFDILYFMRKQYAATKTKIPYKQVLLLPSLLVLLMLVVKLLEMQLNTRFLWGSIYPQKFSHLTGILTAPFIHGDWKHLSNNAISLFPLTALLLLSYKETARPVLIGSFLITGLLVWIGARPSNHIGMSGVIYALASYIFFAGIFQKDPKAMSLSMLTVFLHGSMFWGIFPRYENVFLDNISWESHLMGAATGLLLALNYKISPPPKKKYSWEIEEEILSRLDEIPIEYEEVFPEDETEDHTEIETHVQPKINYVIRKNDATN